MKEYLNKTDLHEKTRLISICLSFVLGWGVTIAGFITPPIGVVDNSILVILGQAMTYVAVGLGMKDYVDTRIKDREKEV